MILFYLGIAIPVLLFFLVGYGVFTFLRSFVRGFRRAYAEVTEHEKRYRAATWNHISRCPSCRSREVRYGFEGRVVCCFCQRIR